MVTPPLGKEGLADDEAGVFGGEEDDALADLLRLLPAAKRHVLRGFLHALLEVLLRLGIRIDIGGGHIHIARRERVDVDAVGCELQGDRTGHAHNGGAGGRIGGVADKGCRWRARKKG